MGVTAKLPYSDAQDNSVLAQDPPAHSQGIAQPSVNILVAAADNAAPDGYVMPDLTSLPVITAMDQLTQDRPEGRSSHLRRREHTCCWAPPAQSPHRLSRPDRSSVSSLWLALASTRTPLSSSPLQNKAVTLTRTSNKRRMKPTRHAANVSPRDFSHAWRALRHRNFRLFFGGQSISAHRHVDDPHRHLAGSSTGSQAPHCSLGPSASPARFRRSSSRPSPVSSSTASIAARFSSGLRRFAMVQSLALAVAHALASHHHRRSPCA